MNAYFKLGPQLRTQDEPAYCGLSSLVMVLNALAVDPGQKYSSIGFCMITLGKNMNGEFDQTSSEKKFIEDLYISQCIFFFFFLSKSKVRVLGLFKKDRLPKF